MMGSASLCYCFQQPREPDMMIAGSTLVAAVAVAVAVKPKVWYRPL
jgi:hypothetical protein